MRLYHVAQPYDGEAVMIEIFPFYLRDGYRRFGSLLTVAVLRAGIDAEQIIEYIFQISTGLLRRRYGGKEAGEEGMALNSAPET